MVPVRQKPGPDVVSHQCVQSGQILCEKSSQAYVTVMIKIVPFFLY